MIEKILEMLDLFYANEHLYEKIKRRELNNRVNKDGAKYEK